jgi:hypothetical protein
VPLSKETWYELTLGDPKRDGESTITTHVKLKDARDRRDRAVRKDPKTRWVIVRMTVELIEESAS